MGTRPSILTREADEHRDGKKQARRPRQGSNVAQERATLTVLGLLALAGMGVLIWQRQRPPVTVDASSHAIQGEPWDTTLAAARQVDINTASAAELERLPQVGPMLAQRIVEYRTAHGPFSSPHELSHVRGIGPKTYEALDDYITTK